MPSGAHTAVLLAVLVACERAEPPPAVPSLPPVSPEELALNVIERERAPVEHPPPEPPGAAWFRRLTTSEQHDVDYACRMRAMNPCFGLLAVKGEDSSALETARRYDENVSFERHCEQKFGPQRGCNTPLVISFDGAPVTFDHDIRPFAFDGEPVATAWPTAVTPWLALDRNGDGVIDSGSELFGDATGKDGFDALARLDDNRDGVIDAHDRAFASLLLWADRDADRRSTPDELTPLASAVTAITLQNRFDLRCTDGDCEGERGTATVQGGAAAAVVDVYLRQR